MHSMTAYASRRGHGEDHSWVWEMRSVNARGLDLRLRLPDGLDGLEATIRATLQKALHRGNVTLSLRLSRDEGADEPELDGAQLDAVLRVLEIVQERAMALGVTLGQPSAADVLNQRGVMVQGAHNDDPTGLVAALATDLGPLLADLTAMRAAEGAALQKVIAGQLDQIAELTNRAAELAVERVPETRKALRAQFARVLAEVGQADPERLTQELALIAVKQDVTEEIDRLRTHIAAAWELIESKGPVGRKLDFLSQEFNREANTLCAKSQYAPLTAVGLDLKAAVDQMREQIQNVE